jgi:hypothetical protein
MFKRNKLYTVVAASALITVSAVSTAQVSETSTATVEVSNSFTFVQDTALSFGSLAIVQNRDLDGDGGADILNPPTYEVGADFSTVVSEAGAYTGDELSTIVEITPGTPASYSISNAARFTPISVTLAGDTGLVFDIAPVVAANPADNVGLTGTLAYANTLVTNASANLNGAIPDPTGNVVDTDGTGTASFAVGATLSPNADSANFPDGDYTGTFTVTVAY